MGKVIAYTINKKYDKTEDYKPLKVDLNTP